MRNKQKIKELQQKHLKALRSKRRLLILPPGKKKKEKRLRQVMGKKVIREDEYEGKHRIVAKRKNGTQIWLVNSDPIEALKDLATISGYYVTD